MEVKMSYMDVVVGWQLANMFFEDYLKIQKYS
jgi:hypothetical protein